MSYVDPTEKLYVAPTALLSPYTSCVLSLYKLSGTTASTPSSLCISTNVLMNKQSHSQSSHAQKHTLLHTTGACSTNNTSPSPPSINTNTQPWFRKRKHPPAHDQISPPKCIPITFPLSHLNTPILCYLCINHTSFSHHVTTDHHCNTRRRTFLFHKHNYKQQQQHLASSTTHLKHYLSLLHIPLVFQAMDFNQLDLPTMSASRPRDRSRSRHNSRGNKRHTAMTSEELDQFMRCHGLRDLTDADAAIISPTVNLHRSISSIRVSSELYTYGYICDEQFEGE